MLVIVLISFIIPPSADFRFGDRALPAQSVPVKSDDTARRKWSPGNPQSHFGELHELGYALIFLAADNV